MHYYKFNIGDYHTHTQHLDIVEDMAYRRMLDWCYLHESPLPDNIDQIARLIRMRTHNESIALVLQEFFTLGEYGWIQAKVEKEIKAYQEKSEKAKASAAARWNKQDANALRNECEGNANHKPLTTNHKPITNNQVKKASAFDFSTWPNQASDEVWKDFVKHRNSVKAKVSQTVINRMANGMHEMVLQGWSVDDVLAEICTRGWKSFKPEWLLKDQIEKNGLSKITQQNIQNITGEW